jgi:hypothetical protein
MAVWLPRTESQAQARPYPTLANRSRISTSFRSRDSLRALNDQIEPARSKDHAVPRMTWWDHRGTNEWVQYDFPETATVSGVAVYWFDDSGVGLCRVPASWQVLYLDGGAWRPVRVRGDYGTAIDGFNEVGFEPVLTKGLRVQVQLQEGFSGGILEWSVR